MAMHMETGSVEVPEVPDMGEIQCGEGGVVETADVAPGKEKPLSKSQEKKLARLKYFADTREQWKADKRARAKAAKLRKRGQLAAAAAAAAGSGSDSRVRGKAGGEDCIEGQEQTGKKQAEPVERVLEPITLIMDCGFDDKMNDKEIISMSCQLTRCYAANRSATHQVSLVVTSLNGRLLARYQSVMKSQHLKWKGVKFSDKDYEVTDENKIQGDLVYLTADSEDTVEDLVPGTSYIIGGIVDRNRYKSLCYNKAKAQGIRTAKLPIGNYIKMLSRFVLTTNQVVEIILKYLECRDWKEAFMAVIPQRKQPELKQKKEGEQDEGCEEEVGEDEVGDDGTEGQGLGPEVQIGAIGSDTLIERETEAGKGMSGDSS